MIPSKVRISYGNIFSLLTFLLEISVHDVMVWSIINTIKMLETSMQQWASQGFTYARTRLAVARSKTDSQLFSSLIALPEYHTYILKIDEVILPN